MLYFLNAKKIFIMLMVALMVAFAIPVSFGMSASFYEIPEATDYNLKEIKQKIYFNGECSTGTKEQNKEQNTCSKDNKLYEFLLLSEAGHLSFIEQIALSLFGGSIAIKTFEKKIIANDKATKIFDKIPLQAEIKIKEIALAWTDSFSADDTAEIKEMEINNEQNDDIEAQIIVDVPIDWKTVSINNSPNTIEVSKIFFKVVFGVEDTDYAVEGTPSEITMVFNISSFYFSYIPYKDENLSLQYESNSERKVFMWGEEDDIFAPLKYEILSIE